MYRRNPSGESVNKSSKSLEYAGCRSTSSILNLFKKSAENCNEETNHGTDSNRENGGDTNNAGECSSTVSSSNKIIFNIVMGKKSTRKHKKWEDDGTLEVTGKRAVVKDAEGNVIHRTSVDPESLVEGFRINVANKEIEIIDRVTPSTSLSNESPKEAIPEPPAKKQRTSSSRPYVPLNSLNKGLAKQK